MFLKNEDVKIGTIPDANGSDNPLRKMEFLTEKEMKDCSEKSSYHLVLLLHITLMKVKAKLTIFFREKDFIMTMVQNMKYIQEILHSHVMELDMPLRISETKILYLWH